jgi:hypothetical protein
MVFALFFMLALFKHDFEFFICYLIFKNICFLESIQKAYAGNKIGWWISVRHESLVSVF